MSSISVEFQPSEVKFICFSHDTRERLFLTRQNRELLHYPGLVPVSSLQPLDSGLIFTLSLQFQHPIRLLEDETITRRRSGKAWKVGEIKQMLKEVSAGLAHAESYGMYASDLSARNVGWSERGFEVLDVHAVGGEVRTLGRNRDVGRESVEGVRLLALWMLHPDPRHRVIPPTLTPILTSIHSRRIPDPAYLTTFLRVLLSDQPLHFLHLSLNSHLYPQLQSLLHCLLPRLSVQITYPCTICQELVPFPSKTDLVFSCEQHFICSGTCYSRASAGDQRTGCPLCRNTRKCRHCQGNFGLGMEEWRGKYRENHDFCCEKCCVSAQKPMFSRETLGKFENIFFLIEGFNFGLTQVPENQRDIVIATSFSGAIFEAFREKLDNEVFTCHFCGERQRDLTLCRWLWCGNGLCLVCTVECLEGFLQTQGVEETSTRDCPTCGKQVSGHHILESLHLNSPLELPLRPYCLGCGRPASEVLPCRHTFCPSCLPPSCPICLSISSHLADFHI